MVLLNVGMLQSKAKLHRKTKTTDNNTTTDTQISKKKFFCCRELHNVQYYFKMLFA